MKLSDDNKINMMYVQQVGDNECWFASYMMVLKYITGTAISYDTEKANVSNLITDKMVTPGYSPYSADDYFKIGGNKDIILLCLQNEDPKYLVRDLVRDLHYDSLHLTTIEEIKQQIEYSLSQNALVILGLNNPDHYVIITAVDDAPHGALTVNIFDPYNCQSSPKTLKVGTLSSNSGSLSLHYMRYNVNGDEYIIDATIGDLIGHPDPNKK